ncbi:MAG TPA: DUF6429 family protein [Gemmatales bacterium]|nr:DUF6429 family protein [Gemmatales bacterium]
MNIDTDKIDDAVLALLHLPSFGDKYGAAAWKGHDWDVLNRLHEKGYIGNPRNKNKSVVFSEQGRAKSKALFREMFEKKE